MFRPNYCDYLTFVLNDGIIKRSVIIGLYYIYNELVYKRCCFAFFFRNPQYNRTIFLNAII